MKTTVEISNPLFAKARRYARHRGLTMKSVIEQGLRKVVAEPEPAGKFKLRRASFCGKGLTRSMQGADWEQIRAAAYEGRGS